MENKVQTKKMPFLEWLYTQSYWKDNAEELNYWDIVLTKGTTSYNVIIKESGLDYDEYAIAEFEKFWSAYKKENILLGNIKERVPFYRWLCIQVDKLNYNNSFAKDAAYDKTFPKLKKTFIPIMAYLQNCSMCSESRNEFYWAWYDYTKTQDWSVYKKYYKNRRILVESKK